MKKGGTAPAVLSAANEIAVQAFLDGRIGFLDIERINEHVLNKLPVANLTDLRVLAEADQAARRMAEEAVK